MSVERRYGIGHPVDFLVHIRYRNRRFVCARACNLSPRGMHLDVHALTLPTGTLVELEIDHQGVELIIPAMVVYHDEGGIGVVFRTPQPGLVGDLAADHGAPPPHLGQWRPERLQPPFA